MFKAITLIITAVAVLSLGACASHEKTSVTTKVSKTYAK